MRTKDALVGIVTDARGWLQGWAGDFEPKEALDAKGTKANPVAWQLGHIACAQDDVIRLFSRDGRGVAPAALRKVCGIGASAPTSRTRYPSLRSLWAVLGKTQARLLRMVEGASEKDLDRAPNEPNDFFRSLGQSVYEISLHELYHVGQVAVLRKAHGKPPVA